MIDAKVIAGSVCKTRITTLTVTMPKFLVAQFNTSYCTQDKWHQAHGDTEAEALVAALEAAQ